MPPSTEPEQRPGGAWKVVAGCFWAFSIASLGSVVGGYAGSVFSGPVHDYGGEWHGLGAFRKLFDTALGAFCGAVIGSIVAGIIIAYATRKKDDHA